MLQNEKIFDRSDKGQARGQTTNKETIKNRINLGPKLKQHHANNEFIRGKKKKRERKASFRFQKEKQNIRE